MTIIRKKNKNLLTIWILLGIAAILYSMYLYLLYTSDMVFLVTVPIEIVVKYFVFGALNLLIGIMLIYEPKQAIVVLYGYVLSVLFFSVFWTIRYYLLFLSLKFMYFLIYEYLMISLIYVTLMNLRKDNDFETLTVFRFVISNSYERLVLGVVIVNFLIYIFAKYLPYPI